jgi:hypothetical protein
MVVPIHRQMKPLLFCCLGFLLWSAVACKQDRKIKVYRVAKESAPVAMPPDSGDPHAQVRHDARSHDAIRRFGDSATGHARSSGG